MSNVVFFPPKSIDDIMSLDEKEVIAGYMIGFSGGKKPTDSRARFVGWKNGMTDSGRIPVSKEQRKIASQFVSKTLKIHRGRHD